MDGTALVLLVLQAGLAGLHYAAACLRTGRIDASILTISRRTPCPSWPSSSPAWPPEAGRTRAGAIG